MIYYNNKKIVKAYYGLKNGYYIGPQHFKNYSDSAVTLTKEKRYTSNNKLVEGSRETYSLEPNEILTINITEFVDNDYYYKVEYLFKTLPWSDSTSFATVFRLNSNETYYKLSNISTLDTPSSAIKSETKPLDWDSDKDSTILPFKQKVTLTTNPEHWSSQVGFKLTIYKLNTATNHKSQIATTDGTVSTSTPVTLTLTFNSEKDLYLIECSNQTQGSTEYIIDTSFYHYIVGNTINTINISNFGGDEYVEYGYDDTI